MGATSAMYPFGFKYEMTPGKYDMEGAVNSAEAVAGLEFYKELYKTGTPPGYTDSYMEQSLDAFKSGQVAMAMNWFAFFRVFMLIRMSVGTRLDSSSTRARTRKPRRLAGRASRLLPIRKIRMPRLNMSSGLLSLMFRRSGGTLVAIPVTSVS